MVFLKFTESKKFQNQFNFFRDTFLILGIFFAGGSMIYAGQQAGLIQQQLRDGRKVNSATFVHTISQELNADKYKNIITAIEGDNSVHDSKFPLLKPRGQFMESDIDDYISNYDTVANLWQEGLIDENMAYNEFSYDMEKAWCNNDVNRYIVESRKADKHYNGDKAFYSSFEEMTKHFFKVDGKTCSDLDKE